MEAAYINQNLSSGHSLNEVMATFFKTHTPDSAKVLFWKLFQCWAVKDCKIKSDVSDEEVALFFDQLIDLVAAAHIEHEANRVSNNPQQGGSNE
jgi:hypothetical protein